MEMLILAITVGVVLIAVGVLGLLFLWAERARSEHFLKLLWLVVPGLVMLLISAPLYYGQSHREGASNRALAVFQETAHSLFTSLSLSIGPGTPQSGGEITLKSGSTVTITTNLAVGSSQPTKAPYNLALGSKDPFIGLTGNLSADNKYWCFTLTTKNPVLLPYRSARTTFTQDGHATDRPAYCLNGRAYYSSDDNLVKAEYGQ